VCIFEHVQTFRQRECITSICKLFASVSAFTSIYRLFVSNLNLFVRPKKEKEKDEKREKDNVEQ